jgi:hypothetical protein
MKSHLYREFYLFNTIIAFQYKSYTVKPVLNRIFLGPDFVLGIDMCSTYTGFQFIQD